MSKSLEIFKQQVRHTLPLNTWLEVKNAAHLQAIKHLIDQRYGWNWFYFELDVKHERYRKREV